jgi:hypothetical protein
MACRASRSLWVPINTLYKLQSPSCILQRTIVKPNALKKCKLPTSSGTSMMTGVDVFTGRNIGQAYQSPIRLEA